MSFSFEVNHRLLVDPRHEPHQVLEPISGYGQAPLVSLAEACRLVESLLGAELQLYIVVAQVHSQEPNNGLSPDEAASIYLYTMEWEEPERSLSNVFNRALRSPDRRALHPWWPFMKLFFGALDKLPSTGVRTVWRGVADDLSALYREGDEMTWWSVSSTTSSYDTLQSPMYLGLAPTHTAFAIETKNGKAIRAYSHLPNDEEILLLSGIFLKVTAVVRHTDGTHIVHLAEIEPFSLRRTRLGYRNPKLEERILSLEAHGKLCLDSWQLTDHDMEIIVDLAITQQRCMILSLRDNAITSVGAAILARAIEGKSGLKSLILDGNRILDAGVQCLAKALTMENNGFLSFYANGVGATDVACESLANLIRTCGRMKYLDLDDNDIGDRGVQVLCEPMKAVYCGLAAMSLSRNKLVTDASVDALCTLIKEGRYFYQLNLIGCSLSVAAKEKLRMAVARRPSFILRLECEDHGLYTN